MDKKLYTLKYTPDANSHLKPDLEKCKTCKAKICTIICPAQVYSCGEPVTVNFENCLECGACKIACPYIGWEYPRGIKGVMFKHG
ncbi:MAG: 4Fe-4S binding protein [Heliobacteriaceae bacterium]|nr:4Fe-4S binding protein [Heliobacteriaceae bacterium]